MVLVLRLPEPNNDFRREWTISALLNDLETYGLRRRSSLGKPEFHGEWTQVKQKGDTPGVRFGCAFFNFGNHTILYGGTTYLFRPEIQKIMEHDDVFLLNNKTMEWEKLTTQGTPHPSG